MNIQIFGIKKCFDTKKAQRFFKERGIKFQFIDLCEQGMSRGEIKSVVSAVGGPDKLADENCVDRELYILFTHLPDSMKEDKLYEEQLLLKTPIVRNGKEATVGYAPDVWKSWH